VTCEVATEVLREIDGGVSDFRPFIRFHTFSEYSVVFTVIMRVKEIVNQFLVTHEFIKRLHRRYRDEGIEIPLPTGTVFLRGGERIREVV
jgi:small-conductance mechanosensitive channel